MKKMMAVFVLLFVSAAVFLAAAFSANAAEEQLKDVDGSNGLKISASADESEDYDYAGGILTIRNDKKVTISGTTTTDRIVVDSTSGANITLSGVEIDLYSTDSAAFEISENTKGTVTVTLDGDNNSLTSGNDCAGLQKNGVTSKLLINGDGSLLAQGKGGGAAIGGAKGESSGNITIDVSNSTTNKIRLYPGAANGGAIGGAAIGGGDGGNGSNITISEGYITREGNSNDAAGIGGGVGGSGSNITINGGVLSISTSGAGAAIGGGKDGEGYKIYIEKGSDISEATSKTGAGIGGGEGKDGHDIHITGGRITNAQSMYGGAGLGGGKGGDGYDIYIELENTSTNEMTMTFKGNATTNNGDGAGIGGGAGGNGTNINIKISGNYTLTANGSLNGAAIGGGQSGKGSKITIECNGTSSAAKATVKAYGGDYSAGIGGGFSGDGEEIDISGNAFAVVYANNSGFGAGIGGGRDADGKNITISGELTVTAEGSSGAGIGGGQSGDGINIKIKDKATVEAEGSSGAGIGGGHGGKADGIFIEKCKKIDASSSSGAGIGGGNGAGDGKNIKIIDCEDVTASGRNGGGAGIGGGAGGSGTDITIDGSRVIATTLGSYGASGIGGGQGGAGSKIYIYDSYVEATGAMNGAGIGGSPANDIHIGTKKGSTTVIAQSGGGANGIAYGAGIGGGAGNSGSNITISGDTEVTTQSVYGAAIGGGVSGTGEHITIEGCKKIDATSSYGAGIGGGAGGNGIDIKINGGTINAKSAQGAGIGGGANKSGIDIKISGGTVFALGSTGIGGQVSDSTVYIKGKDSTHYPWVFTNKITSANYDNRENDDDDGYWGIVFECADGDTFTDIEDNNFNEGIVYGKNKTVSLAKPYSLVGAGKKLTVLDTVTFKTNDKFTLNGSVLYLKEGATLDKWYEMTKENGGEIKHEHRSDYQWYDVEDHSFINTTNYKKLYTLGDKEGIVLCDICGEPEPHNYDTTGGWEKDDTHHWHLGECDLGTDCSVNENQITICSYIVDGKLDYGTHTYNFDDVPEYKDGEWIFKCTVCEFELSMEIPVISLFKVDGENNPLAGAEFGLYSDAACTTRLTSATSAKNAGKAVAAFESGFGGGNYIKPNTTYYIKETKAPEGYKLSDKVFAVSVAIVDGEGKVTYGAAGSEEPPICENIANVPDEPEDPEDPENPENPKDPDDPKPDDPKPDDPTPDDPTPAPGDNDNPNTGIGFGIAGLTLLGGSLCVVSVTKRRRK